MMTAMATTKTKKPAKEPTARRRSALTEAGEAAKREAMRKLLLKTLKEHGWNLTKTAEALGMGSGSGGASYVSKTLKDLAPQEYASAKVDGRITNYHREE